MPTDPQKKYFDDQDVLTIDIDQLYTNFIIPIDQLRNHFNALNPNAQQLGNNEYQESRVSAFYRAIGFPVVSPASSPSFYSPGFDPNLNTDANSLSAYASIAKTVSNDTSFVQFQLDARETTYKLFRKVFSDGGINAIATTLGSFYIRDLSKQFDDSVGPLVQDPSQIQIVKARVDDITQFVNGTSQSANFNPKLLTSFHLLKPFVVDPRIDSNIQPAVNRICAPFLLDKSQTKIFQSQTGTTTIPALKRPYIERVISVRFNTNNVIKNSDLVQSIISFIESNSSVTNSDLVSITNNTLSALYSSELIIFNNYFKIIRALIEKLHNAIVDVEKIRKIINFQPIPDSKNGIEVGGTLNTIDPNDKNNLRPETDYVILNSKKIAQEISFDVGLQGVPDTGDFVFSNLDDTVFEVFKSVPKSYDDLIKTVVDKRNQLGNEGIEDLKIIEIIMGEFSGLGLIDIVAIQAALWVMDSGALLGLIDDRARARIKNRPDLNINAVAPKTVSDSLQNFEQTLKNIYVLIQKYFGDLSSGVAFTSN